ncbi:hypothetical protein D3C71_1607360 [compost metagenome]
MGLHQPGGQFVFDDEEGKVVVVAVEIPDLEKHVPLAVLNPRAIVLDQVRPALFLVVVPDRDDAPAAGAQACEELAQRKQQVFVGQQVRDRVVARNDEVVSSTVVLVGRTHVCDLEVDGQTSKSRFTPCTFDFFGRQV